MSYSLTSIMELLGAKDILRLERRDAFLVDGREFSTREVGEMLKAVESGRKYFLPMGTVIREMSNASGTMVMYRGAEPPRFLQPGPRSCAYCRGSKRDVDGRCWGCGAL